MAKPKKSAGANVPLSNGSLLPKRHVSNSKNYTQQFRLDRLLVLCSLFAGLRLHLQKRSRRFRHRLTIYPTTKVILVSASSRGISSLTKPSTDSFFGSVTGGSLCMRNLLARKENISRQVIIWAKVQSEIISLHIFSIALDGYGTLRRVPASRGPSNCLTSCCIGSLHRKHRQQLNSISSPTNL